MNFIISPKENSVCLKKPIKVDSNNVSYNNKRKLILNSTIQ